MVGELQSEWTQIISVIKRDYHNPALWFTSYTNYVLRYVGIVWHSTIVRLIIWAIIEFTVSPYLYSACYGGRNTNAAPNTWTSNHKARQSSALPRLALLVQLHRRCGPATPIRNSGPRFTSSQPVQSTIALLQLARRFVFAGVWPNPLPPGGRGGLWLTVPAKNSAARRCRLATDFSLHQALSQRIINVGI